MKCVLLGEHGKRCYAYVRTPSWEVDEDTLNKYCKTEKFDDCPRYCAFIEYQETKSTLKFEST